MAGKNKKLVGVALLLILLCGGFLRFYRLGEKSLWVDEIITYEISTGDINISKISHSGYFLLTRLATKLGANDLTIRLPSALFGIIGIISIFLFTRLIFDNTTGLLAAFFLAIWPLHINFSQEARYYSVMFCYASFVFYFLLLFFRRHYWWGIIFSVIVSYISYLNHPTSAVLFLTTIIYIPLWLILFPEERNQVIHKLMSTITTVKSFVGIKLEQKKAKKRVTPSRARTQRIFSYILIIGILFFLVHLFGMHLIIKAINELSHLGKGKTPEVEFSINFFWQHIKIFTPEIFNLPYLNKLTFVVLIIGFLLIVFHQLSFMVLYVILILNTFIAVFSVTTGQTYHPKYVFFITPTIIAAYAGGLSSIAKQISKLNIPNVRQRFLYASVLILGLSLYGICNSANLLRYYTLERTAIKEPLKMIKEQLNDKDIIAAYDLQIGPIKHYLGQLNISDKSFLPLPAESGCGCINRGLLKQAGVQNHNIWFIDLWTTRMPPQLIHWVKDNFLLISTYPSIYQENTVRLLKWKYPQSYIYKGNALKYNYNPPRSILNFSKHFLSERELESVIIANIINKNEQVLNVKIMLNNKEGNWHTIPCETETIIEEKLLIPAKDNQLNFKLYREEENAGRLVFLKELSIIPEIEDNLIFQAEEPDRVHPTWHKKTLCEDNIYYLKLMRNSFADYLIELPQDGQYKFSLRAKNDKPGPVLLEISVDDKPKGILSFDRKDNSWQIKSFPLALTAGLHRFTVSFINDFGKEGEEDAENDAIMDYIQLEKLEPGVQVTNDRLQISDAIFKISNVIPSGLFIRTGNEVNLASQWRIIGECKAEICFDHMIDRELPALKLWVEAESKGITVISPPFEISEDKLFYWSVKLKTEDLINHSANACMYYFNQQHQVIKVDWSAIEGINKTTDWIRHIYFRSSPPQAKYAAIGFAIYPNSNRPSAKGGYVYIADFRQELP